MSRRVAFLALVPRRVQEDQWPDPLSWRASLPWFRAVCTRSCHGQNHTPACLQVGCSSPPLPRTCPQAHGKNRPPSTSVSERISAMPAPASLETPGIPALLLSPGGFKGQPFNFPQVVSGRCLRARACLSREEKKTKPTTLHFCTVNLHFRTFGHISWKGKTPQQIKETKS